MLKTNPEKFVPKTILFVENEVFLAIPEFKILEECGYAVIYVNSGEKAIEVIESNKYEIDLVVFDVDIRARINGPDTIKHILAKKELPIVLLTSSKNEHLAEIDDNLVYGFVAKNSDNRGVLVKTIQAAFKHFQLYKSINEKEQLYRSIFNSSFQFNAILTTEGILLDGNRTGVNFFGLDVNDYIGHPFWEVPTWKGKEDGLKEAVKKATQGQLVRYKLEVPTAKAIAVVDFSLKPVMDKEGKVSLLIAEGRDITKYQIIAKELERSEETFAKYFYKNSNPMTISDMERGILLDVNDKFIENFGYVKKDIIGRSSLELPLWVNPQDRIVAVEKLKRDGGVYNFETKLFTKQREVRDVLFSWASIESQGKEVLMAAVTDITELNKYKEQIQTKEKMQSIGILAGGIAHDFNNLLQGMSSYLELIEMKLKKYPQDEKLMEYLRLAIDVFSRAKELARQLLTYSKGGQPRKEIISLKESLSKCVNFNLSGSEVMATIEISDDLWPVNVDLAQIEQVISNLVINAKQAMSKSIRKELHVVARNLTEQEIPSSLTKGNYILISISDKGGGISEENLGKIFVPFFTTKKEGSGLGLSTAYSIINKHRGLLDAKSTFGQGTTFNIYLPAEPEGEIKFSSALPADPLKLQGKILLMDDDPAILKPVGIFLKNCGHEVTAVTRGEDAISECFNALQKNEPFDIAILDLTIRNGLGGKETMLKLKAIDKSTQIFFASGYSEDPAILNPEQYDVCGSISKPYRLNELQERIEKIMSKKQEASKAFPADSE